MAAILEAAIQVLHKEGAARFTMARVAAKAGVSVGSLYQYFPNKAALLFRLQSDMEPYFLAEALLIGIGVWAIFWHPRPARQLTSQEQLDQSNAQARRPLYILRSFWRRYVERNAEEMKADLSRLLEKPEKEDEDWGWALSA